jgi:hypothetical protein
MQNDILIDVYRDTSAGELPSGRTVLVSGILTSGRFVERGTWKICGRQQVDPSEVSFPERLAIDTISRSKFTQGEVVLPVKISMEETERIDVIPRSLPAITLGEVVLYQLGRKQEIKNPRLSDVELRSLARYDLRFSQHRSRVFECLDLDPDQSYYERARALGYDLARFYGS